MLKKKEYDQKHLTTSQRIHIEKGLNDGLSFAAIARKLDKHPSTIAKEVKKYRTFQPRSKDPRKTARCALFKECTMRFLCDKKDCVKMCKSCYDTKLMVSKCSYLCPEYREPQCESICKAPYVCNHCARQRTCNINKASIIGTAIAVLELLISKVFIKTLELADKVISKELEARPENTDFKEQKAVPEESRKQADTPKPAIPPRPQPSPEAVSYKHLCEIYQKLQEQNKAIFALEKQRSDLEIELSDSKGIFKSKRRSELSTEIAGLEERIARMKVRLSHIVKEYGYPNVEAFYKAFHKAETAYGDYQDSLKNWKQRYGEKPQSLHDRLKSKKQDIRERELTRPYSPPNRGRSR